MAATNGPTRPAPPRSSETAATATLSPSCVCRRSSDGISLRQGWHHVAHKLTTTGLPLKSAMLAGLPSASVNPVSGAGCGALSGINSPSLSFSSSAAAAAERATRSATATVANQADHPRNPNWGGRFDGGPAAIMRRINASIDFDKRLYAEDIAGSLAHCAMLVAQRILTPEDGVAITKGLEQIRSEIDRGEFVFSEANEDIHLNIEARLAELIGPIAGRLHTARSRNDQIATDFRLWVRGAIERTDAAMRDLQAALIDRAEA